MASFFWQGWFFYYRLLAFSGILDDIHDHMDTTDHRLVRETRHIRVIDRKSNTCCKFTVRLLSCVLRRNATPPCLSVNLFSMNPAKNDRFITQWKTFGTFFSSRVNIYLLFTRTPAAIRSLEVSTNSSTQIRLFESVAVRTTHPPSYRSQLNPETVVRFSRSC